MDLSSPVKDAKINTSFHPGLISPDLCFGVLAFPTCVFMIEVKIKSTRCKNVFDLRFICQSEA